MQGDPVLNRNTEKGRQRERDGGGRGGEWRGEDGSRGEERRGGQEKSGEEREKGGDGKNDKRHTHKTQLAPSWFKMRRSIARCGAGGGGGRLLWRGRNRI